MKPVQKIIVVLLTLSLASCSPSSSQAADQDGLDINSLKKALALGRMTDLNAQSTDTEHELLVRLYEVPIFENDCFVETHGICQYEYFITLSTYDEYPDSNVYKLPVKGELQGFNWLADDVPDREQIEFRFAKYSKAALANNSQLVNQQSAVTVKLGARVFEVVVK